MIRAAVLGAPISHSLSPILHRCAYKYLGISGEYTAIEVRAEVLADFVKGLDESWTGFSLTMPLKEEILKIADEVDTLAFRINSANTLLRSEIGWQATTTDVAGFTAALASRSVVDFSSVLIIGSGATARAAAAACDSINREIFVLHRSSHREAAMKLAAPSTRIYFIPWDGALPPTDLVINTTPAYVADQFADRLHVRPQSVFFESLYNPWPTKVLANWQAEGGLGIDGLDLLIYQGMEQVSLMTHSTFDRTLLAPILRSACLAALKD